MIKTIVKEHTIPALSAAAGYETRIDLGVESKKVLGYYVQVLQNGGLIPEQCKLSFANSSKTVFEPVSLGHLIVSTAVKIKDRFYNEEPFDVDGYFNAKLIIPSAPVTPVVVQYIVLVDTKR